MCLCVCVCVYTCYFIWLKPFLFACFQVLNLFLALLLSSFVASSLSAAPGADSDTNKLTEAFNRISRFKAWVKRSIARGFRMIRSKLTNQISDQRPPGESLIKTEKNDVNYCYSKVDCRELAREPWKLTDRKRYIIDSIMETLWRSCIHAMCTLIQCIVS